MSPVLDDGDFLVVDTAAYRRESPRPGDIALVCDPREPSRELINRVIDAGIGQGAWVEGENPPASTDSRHFGRVPRELFRGRVVLRYWPGRPVSAASFASTRPSVGNANGGGAAGST